MINDRCEFLFVPFYMYFMFYCLKLYKKLIYSKKNYWYCKRMPMEKRAICAPKSIPLFLHSNEEATCPATTHLLAPLVMRYGHVINFSPPGCKKQCVRFSGLVNKLPQQVHSSMFILSFCDLGWRRKPLECPGSYFLKMTETQLAWVPEKLCGASPLLLSPALNS